MDMRPAIASFLLLSVLTPVSTLASACALLNKAEIHQVQGDEFKEAKSSSRSAGGMTFSQCVYILPAFADSVSLELTEPVAGANPHAVRDLWKERVVSEEVGQKGANERRLPVGGVGVPAYWIRNGPTGALYVLHGNKLLRLSLGGSLSENQKIAHARQLMRMAIKRIDQKSG